MVRYCQEQDIPEIKKKREHEMWAHAAYTRSGKWKSDSKEQKKQISEDYAIVIGKHVFA